MECGGDGPGATAPPPISEQENKSNAPDDDPPNVKLSSSGGHVSLGAKPVHAGFAKHAASAPARLSTIGTHSTGQDKSKDDLSRFQDPSSPVVHASNVGSARARSSAEDGRSPGSPSNPVKRARVRSPNVRAVEDATAEAPVGPPSSPGSDHVKLMDKLAEYVQQCGGTLPTGWSVEVRFDKSPP